MPALAVLEPLVERYSRHVAERAETSNGAGIDVSPFIESLLALLGWFSTPHTCGPVTANTRRGEATFSLALLTSPDSRLVCAQPSTPASPGHSLAAVLHTRRYAWSARVDIAMVCDFEHLAVYDCRLQPLATDDADSGLVLRLHCSQYVAQWDRIQAWVGSSAQPSAVLPRLKRSEKTLEQVLLRDIEQWREALVMDLFALNPGLPADALSAAAQRIVDHVLFLRIAEDHGIEPCGQLRALANGEAIFERLNALFAHADSHYGSASVRTATLPVDAALSDAVLSRILLSLYAPLAPYDFGVLSPNVLGQVYEQFLGKTVVLDGTGVVIEEKPEIRKAGGVYYTPTAIARYIVETTVGPALRALTPAQLDQTRTRAKDRRTLRILDPACGSGAFLLVAYEYLLDWYLAAYLAQGPQRHAQGARAKVYRAGGGRWRLCVREKQRILTTHIFGVDIDPRAVEVTQLALLLKVFEGEYGDLAASQLDLFDTHRLPGLARNIKCGNTLIGDDVLALGDDSPAALNPFNWHTEFFQPLGKRFDIVLGNPPYLYSAGSTNKDYFAQHYRYSQYQTDLYQYFIERSYQLLDDSGVVSYIVPDSWLNSQHFSNLRTLMTTVHGMTHLVFFDYQVFKSANIENVIFIGGRRPSDAIEVIRSPRPGVFQAYSRLDVVDVVRRGLIDPRYTAAGQRIIDRVAHLRCASGLFDINRGLHAYRTDGYGASRFQPGPQTPRDKNERSYHSDVKLDDSYWPEIRGRDVGFFTYQAGPDYVSYGDWLAEPRAARYMSGPRLMLRKTLGRRLSCALIDEPAAIDQSLYIALSRSGSRDELKLLAAVAGSRFGSWYLRTRYAIHDRLHPWYTKKNLDDLPLPELASALITAYDQLAAARQEGWSADAVQPLEERLDTAVFDAYGLSCEERAWVLAN